MVQSYTDGAPVFVMALALLCPSDASAESEGAPTAHELAQEVHRDLRDDSLGSMSTH